MAATISFHPSPRSKKTSKTMASTVPTNCTRRWRLRANQEAIYLLSQYFPNGIGRLPLRFMVRSGEQFRDQTHKNGLEAQNKKHDTQREKRRWQNRDPLDELANEQGSEQNATAQNEDHSSSTEETHRFVGIIQQKFYGEQI